MSLGAGAVAARLRDYWRIFSLWTAYALLATLWGEEVFAFFRNVWPRFSHFGPAGMRVMDRPCSNPQCDFSVFWPAGVLARAGRVAEVYAPGAFTAVRQGFFGPHVGKLAWYYPPPSLLAVTPFSYLPFEPAFYVWCAALTGVALWLLRRAGLPWVVVTVGLLSPAALWNLELGQWGAVTGAACFAGLLLVENRPVWAGAVLGFLVMKPQAGFLAPVALAGARAWRAMAAGGVAVVILAAAAALWFGAGVWRDALAAGTDSLGSVLVNPDLSGATAFGVSVFWMLRGFGASLALAGAGQAAAVVVVAGIVFGVWRRAVLRREALACLTVCLAPLVSSYGYTDDLVGYSTALAMMAWRRGWRIDLLDTGLFCWPILSPLVFEATGMLLTPAVVAVAAVKMAWWGYGGRTSVPPVMGAGIPVVVGSESGRPR